MKRKTDFLTYSIKKNFLGLEKKFSDFDNSKIVILPCPYEKTTSYGKGTVKGPDAILKASRYVEFFDVELVKEICFDCGIATILPLSFNNLNDKQSFNLIYKKVQDLLKFNKFVVTLGGEHSISVAPVKAHFDEFNKLIGGFSILHFDAHSDLRQEYEGSKYSHASFAARVSEFTTSITQIGIRAQCIEEYNFIKEKGINTFYSHQIRERGFNNNFINDVLKSLNKNIYITFDVDYFDPSIMPSTGTPEPNGFYWDETMRLLKKVIKYRNLLGFDVVELSPKKDFPFPDFLTAKLVYKILSYKFV